MFKRIYLEITNVCNLRCSFCPGTRRQGHFMTEDEFSFLTRRLRGHAEYLYLHVMGEPLLHPQLPQLLRIAAQAGFKICLTTNGTLLQKKLDVLLSADKLHKISVSLHSFEGNDCAGDLDGYVTSVAESCAALAQRGVICALRLWNDGGAQTRNGDILDILSRALCTDVRAISPDVRGNWKLGERLYLDSGTLTPLLKKLESRGLINRCRCKHDERSLIVTLTEEGKALRERALDVPRQMASLPARK